MLAKNRLSALILTLASFLGAAAGYTALAYPRLFDPAPPLPAAFLIGMGLILALLAVLISRSTLVMGLDEPLGFGWQGAARWLVCGVIAGFLTALTNLRLLPLMKEDSALYNIVELAAFLLTAYIAYRVAFGKNVFKVFFTAPPSASRPSRGAISVSDRAAGWLIILLALLVLIGMIFLGFNTAGVDTPRFILALGGACVALGGIWMGTLLLGRLPRRATGLLTLLMLAVIAAGILLLMAGILMGG